MLFKDEKREPIKIKAKPGVVEVAEELYGVAYPFADEANLDNLFEELVVRKAWEVGLLPNPQQQEAEQSIQEETVEEQEVEAENAATLEVGELLGN